MHIRGNRTYTLSLRNSAGSTRFSISRAHRHMSDTMRWFVGGHRLCFRTAGRWSNPREQLFALVPGFWAPTDATWGNREPNLRPAGAFRVRRQASAVEYRVAAADINPYLAIAAALVRPLGIEHRSSRTRLFSVMPMRWRIRRACAAAHVVGSRRQVGRHHPSPAICLATPSSTTMQ